MKTTINKNLNFLKSVFYQASIILFAMKKIFILTILLFLGSTFIIFGQDVEIVDQRGPEFGTPQFDHLEICHIENDTLNILIDPSNGGSLVTNATFTINYPAGLYFDGYVATVPPGIVTGDDGGSDVVTFNLADFDQPFEIHIGTRADCRILALTDNLLPVEIEYTLDDEGTLYTLTPDAYNTQIFTPFLNLLAITPDYPELYSGQTIDRTIMVSQNGINASLTEFTYSNIYSGTVIYNQISITNGVDVVVLPFTDDATTVSATITQADLLALGLVDPVTGLGSFEEDADLWIIENITATCTNLPPSEFIASWGCGGDVCKDQSVFNGYNLGIGTPQIVIASVASPATPDACSATNHVDVTFTNNGFELLAGASYAKDIIVSIESGCNGVPSPNNMLDPSSFTFGGVSITPSSSAGGVFQFDVSALIMANPALVGAFIDQDNDGNTDDLLVGDVFVIGFDYSLSCSGSSVCGGNNPSFVCSGFNVTVDYADQCGMLINDTYDPVAEIIDMSGGSSALGQPDIVGTPPTAYSLNFCYDYMYEGIDCPGATAYLQVNYLNVDNAPVSAMVDGMPANITHTPGNTFFTVDGALLDGIISQCWDIDLVFAGTLAECEQLDELFEFQVIYDCPCCSPSTTVRACSTYEATIKRPGNCPSCATLIVDAFNIERTTFSWTDASMATIADPNVQSLVTDHVLTCDDSQWTIGATAYGNPGDQFMDFELTVNIPQGINPFAFLDGTVLFNGAPTGCILAAPTLSMNGGAVVMTYSIDQVCLGQVIVPGDVVEIVANYNTIDIPEIGGDFTFLYPRGEISLINGGPVPPDCDGSAGFNFYVANPEMMPELASDVVQGCTNVQIVGSISNNSSTGDDFPNEFRPLFGEITGVSFTIPEGYYFVPGSAQITTYGPTATTINLSSGSGLTIVGNDVTFNYDDSGIILDKDAGGSQIEFSFELEPNCASPSGMAVFNANIEQPVLYALPFEPACVAPTVVVNEMDDIGYTNPPFTLTPVTPVREGVEREISWIVKSCNIGGGTYDFMYMAFENISTDITFAAVYDVTDSILNGGAKELITPLEIYGGGISANWVSIETPGNPFPFTPLTCRYYEVNATYNSCVQDQVTVKMAGNCGDPLIDPLTGYTGNFGTYNCLNEVSTVLDLFPQDPSLQINLLTQPSPPNNLCSPLEYVLELKNVAKGYLYDIDFDIFLPADGLEFVPGSFMLEYPIGTGYTAIAAPNFVGTSAQGDQYNYFLNDVNAILADMGIHGVTGDPDFGRLLLRYEVEATCDYVYGGITSYEGIGVKPCGDPSDGTLQSSFPLKIPGDEPYLLTPSIAAQSLIIPVCDGEMPNLQINIANAGPDDTGSNPNIMDSISITLPQDLTFVGNTVGTGAPLITMSGLQEVLIFPIPTGITAGSTGSFTFDVDGIESLGCANDVIIMEPFSIYTASCVSMGGTCAIPIPTGNPVSIPIEFAKPDLTLSATTSFTSCTGSNTDEEVSVTLRLTNTTVASLIGTDYDVVFYEDDGNNVFDGTETVLSTYTYDGSVSPALVVGNNQVTHTFTLPAGTACNLHMVFDGTAHCLCVPDEQVVDLFDIDYQNAGADIAICHETTGNLGCGDLVLGYTYTWAEPVPGSLSCTNCPNPSILPLTLQNVATPNDPNAASIDLTYTLTTMRGLTGCTTMDDVIVTVYPFFNGFENITICQEETPTATNAILATQDHIPAGSNTFVWVENLANPQLLTLDDLTIRSPQFSATTPGIYIFDLTYLDPNGCLAVYQSTIVVDERPIISAGANDVACAALVGGNAEYTFSASIANVGTGTWTVESGPGTITFAPDANDPMATASGLENGNCYTFRWTVVNNTCTVFEEIGVCVLTEPTAGADQDVCGDSTTLEGNAPQNAGETGTWTQISGPGIATFIPNANDPGATVTDMTTEQTYVFRWTIDNGTCSLFDEVTLNTFEAPIISAGPDQELCNVLMTNLAGSTNFGTGSWTTTSGANIVDPTDANTAVNGLVAGNCYNFDWTVDNGGVCTIMESMQVCVIEAADAGPDQQICALTTQLAANTPTIGTGQWSLIQGDGAVFNPLDPQTAVTNLTQGETYVFQWTISGNTCVLSDTVEILIYDTPCMRVNLTKN